MCKGGGKKRQNKPQTGGNKNAARPQNPAQRAKAAEAAAASPAGVEAAGETNAGNQRRRRRGKRGFRLAGQNKLRLSPAKANVGGSGRTGLNIPRSS